MIFILCESRSSNMYRAIWNKILELVPMLQHNVKFIMSDYETAAMKVINEQFPAAAAHGCWFHYNQVCIIILHNLFFMFILYYLHKPVIIIHKYSLTGTFASLAAIRLNGCTKKHFINDYEYGIGSF